MATLLEFKAGQIDFNSESGDAVPLAGQGRVAVKPAPEDEGMLALQWVPRGKNRASSGEELLILPGDVEFTHAPECGTGRVIQMRFQSSGQRLFFWLQDAPAGDLNELSQDDRSLIVKLNELANQELEAEAEDADESMQVDESTPLTKEESDSSDRTVVQNATAAQDATAAQQTSTTQRDTATQETSGQALSGAATGAHGPGNQASNLQSVLRTALARNLGEAQQRQPQALSKVFDGAARTAHVYTASDEELASLLKHTPGVATTREELAEVVQSPHFASALDHLGLAVLESPALAQEIGLSRQPVSMEDFLELLRETTQGDDH